MMNDVAYCLKKKTHTKKPKHVVIAVSVVERCRLANDYGLCHGSQLQWFHDSRTQLCRSFQYSGCGGNANRFDTYGACTSVCSGVLHRTGAHATPIGHVTQTNQSGTPVAPYRPKVKPSGTKANFTGGLSPPP